MPARADLGRSGGRQIIRLTVDAPVQDDARPRRGYRRVQWIETALEPLRADLDDEQFVTWAVGTLVDAMLAEASAKTRH